MSSKPVRVTVPMSALWPSGTGRILGDGTHTAVAYDDGVEFGRSTFKVATLLGENFVRGLSGRFRARDFPDPGVNTLLRWNQNVQGFVIEGVEE